MENLSEKIRQHYVDFVLNNGRKPASVFVLMNEIGESEQSFYQYFGSLEAIEKQIWAEWFENTLSSMKADEATYTNYSVREKMLSFCFTMFAALQNHRSFVLATLPKNPIGLGRKNDIVKHLQDLFKPFADELLTEGLDSGEIASRPFITDYYHYLLWILVLGTLYFWKKDESPNFEKTDELIEKSVNFLFDLINRNAFDSGFDYAKFVFQFGKLLK